MEAGESTATQVASDTPSAANNSAAVMVENCEAEKDVTQESAAIVEANQGQPEEKEAVEAKKEPEAAKEGKKDGDAHSEDTDDDDEEEVIEESPCGRYNKRREVVKYRDVPGIDTAYLAMDTEEGVEVVWNEAVFSETKKFKAQEDKLKNVFEALTLIDHPNIVKFHRYWTDGGSVNVKAGEKHPPRLVFITEFMSSGSLKQFLRKTKKNYRKIQVRSWKRWCTQILSALNYLHATCEPPILHGNLTCDTIFIQHNGLVKIGSVAPDIIHQNVKTCRDNIRNLHFLAPEWGMDSGASLSTPVDIYAFGMCALETAALELLPLAAANNGNVDKGTKELSSASEACLLNSGGNHSSTSVSSQAVGANAAAEIGGTITEEAIQRTIDSLEDEMQKDFIRKCLRKDPRERPTARELLFHPVLFEVHSLKLLAAHILVNTPANINETMTDEAIQTHYGRDNVMATRMRDGKVVEYKLSDFPVAEKLEKFMEDVKYGIYPLTAFALSQPPPAKTRAVTPEGTTESAKSVTPEPHEPEHRWGIDFRCYIGPPVPALPNHVTLVTRLCDGMNRQMQAGLEMEDTPELLAHDLYINACCNWRDVPSIARLMTLGYIQRANETAEYVAKMAETTAEQEGQPPEQEPCEEPQQQQQHQQQQQIVVEKQEVQIVQDEPINEQQELQQAVQANPEEVSKTPPTATVVVSEAQEAAAEAAAPAPPPDPVQQQQQQPLDDVAEDPTPPQPLEGRLEGIQPMVGRPQMGLSEAVAAGANCGGLHYPKDDFEFTGAVAEIKHQLDIEIAEWQRRLQAYLSEVSQQQELLQAHQTRQKEAELAEMNGNPFVPHGETPAAASTTAPAVTTFINQDGTIIEAHPNSVAAAAAEAAVALAAEVEDTVDCSNNVNHAANGAIPKTNNNSRSPQQRE